MTVKLLFYTPDGDRLIAAASKQTIAKKPVDPYSLSEKDVEMWIIETFRRQHWSPWEFSHYTFLISDCSRVCSHQLVRHRLASFAQLSQRYSEGYLRKMVLKACKEIKRECPRKPVKREDYLTYARALEEFASRYMDRIFLFNVLDNVGEEPIVNLAKLAFVLPPDINRNARIRLALGYIKSVATYYRLLYEGTNKEDARFILPQSTKTSLYMSMNARELVTVFLPLRMCTHAQWEIRALAWKVWEELVNVHPLLFKYVGPRCVMMENAIREKPVTLENLLAGKEEFTIERCPELVPREGMQKCLKYASRALDSNTYDPQIE